MDGPAVFILSGTKSWRVVVAGLMFLALGLIFGGLLVVAGGLVLRWISPDLVDLAGAPATTEAVDAEIE